MKKKSKPTRKQIRRKQAKQHRKQDQRRRQQSLQQIEEQLWRELQPLATDYDFDNKEDFNQFATHVMIEATALYDEPEFEDWSFEPADAARLLMSTFSAYMPPPDKLDTLPEEEQLDLMTEASVRAIAPFMTPELQKDMLDTLGRCRRRLKREKQTDKLALAAATEWLLRSTREPHIWGTCGIFHQMLREAIQVAAMLEEEKDQALKLAQALQPDVETEYDLVEGTPAYETFWRAIEANPELSHFVQRQAESEALALAWQAALDADLVMELFDDEELDRLLDDLETMMQEEGDLPENEAGVPSWSAEAALQLVKRMPALLKGWLAPDRFEEMMQDLEKIAASEAEPFAPRARLLHQELKESQVPYWESPILAYFLFGALTELMIGPDEEEDEGGA